MLPSMAAGLGSILFAITIDNSLLNTSTDPFAKSCQDEMSILASTRSNLTSSASVDDKTTTDMHDKDVVKKKKKPRKSAPKIVDFDESDMGRMREQREASVSSDTRWKFIFCFFISWIHLGCGISHVRIFVYKQTSLWDERLRMKVCGWGSLIKVRIKSEIRINSSKLISKLYIPNLFIGLFSSHKNYNFW